MNDAIEAVLRGAGLTDKPGEYDSSIHSWRCEHPQTYGPCECFQELVRELAEVERAAAEKAYERGRLDERHDCNRYTEYQRGVISAEQLQRDLRSSHPYLREETE